MADVRMYRLSTDWVYATVTSTTDPSAAPVWMAVKPVGIPAGDSDLLVAQWVPGETWTDNKRRARLMVGPESDIGALNPGQYRVWSKTDLDPRVPFEDESYRLFIESGSNYVPPATPALAAVAFSGEYDDLIGAPDATGAPFLPRSGGTITGPITWSGTPSASGHLATKAYVDGLVFDVGLSDTRLTGPLFSPEDYGTPVGDGVADDYTAVKAAWDAMLAYPLGRGKLLIPATKRYRVDLSNTARVGVTGDKARASLPLPQVPRTEAKRAYGIISAGEAYVVRTAELGGTPVQVNTCGGLFFDTGATTYTWSNTLGLPCAIGGPDADMTDPVGNSFSNLHFSIENVILRQSDNPSLCTVNLEQISTCRIDNVRIDVASVLDQIPLPTHPTGAAILLPRSNNNVVVDVGRLLVEGYYAGPPLTEHLRADSVIALRCKIALPIRRPCSHIGLLHHAKVEQCPWGISGYDPSGTAPDGGVVPIPGWTGHINVLDIEDYAYNGTTPWIYAPVEGAHINDADGVLNGQIGFLNRVNSEPPSPTGIGIGPGGGSSSLYVIGPSGTNSPVAIYGQNHGVAATRLASPNAPAVNLYRLWDAVTGPATSQVDATALNLGTKVQVTAAAEATRIAFWKVADVTGAITGRLWRKEGASYTQVGADVTFSFDPSFEGWVFAELPDPVDLDVGADPDTDPVYIPTVHFPTRFPFTASYWDSGPGGSGIIAGPLRAYSNVDAGGQGVFSTGALTNAPSTSGGGSGYWVDLEIRSAA